MGQNNNAIDLGNPQILTRYVNQALAFLHFLSDPGGWLPESSSEKTLLRKFPDLTPTQVRQINSTLFQLGLRDTQVDSGGGMHHIRPDVLSVTTEQVRAGKPIPLQEGSAFGEPTRQFVEDARLVLSAIRECADLIPGVTQLASVELGRYQEMAKNLFSGLGTTERILALLRQLGIIRTYAVREGSWYCFVDTTLEVTEENTRFPVAALRSWPDDPADLLPQPEPPQLKTPADAIVGLLRVVRKLELLNANLARQLQARETRTDGLLQIVAQLEARNAALEEANAGLVTRAEELEEQLRETREQLEQAEVNTANLSGVYNEADAVLKRYGLGGGS